MNVIQHRDLQHRSEVGAINYLTLVCHNIQLYYIVHFVSQSAKKVVIKCLICRAYQCQISAIFHLWPRSKVGMWLFLVETFICKLSAIEGQRSSTYQRRIFFRSYSRNVFIEIYGWWFYCSYCSFVLNKSTTYDTLQKKFQNKLYILINLFAIYYIMTCH